MNVRRLALLVPASFGGQFSRAQRWTEELDAPFASEGVERGLIRDTVPHRFGQLGEEGRAAWRSQFYLARPPFA
jgi:hypothetical protein